MFTVITVMVTGITFRNFSKIYSIDFIYLNDRHSGGNMLLNVGPTHDGNIPPIFEDTSNSTCKCQVVLIRFDYLIEFEFS